MAQISLYVDETLADELSIAAKVKGSSVSKYVAQILRQHFDDQNVRNQAAWDFIRWLSENPNPDPTFVEPPDPPPEDFSLEDDLPLEGIA